MGNAIQLNKVIDMLLNYLPFVLQWHQIFWHKTRTKYNRKHTKILGRKSANFGSYVHICKYSSRDFTSGNTACNYNITVQTLLLYCNHISFPHYAWFLKQVWKLYSRNGSIPSSVVDITEYNKAQLLLKIKRLLFMYLLC